MHITLTDYCSYFRRTGRIRRIESLFPAQIEQAGEHAAQHHADAGQQEGHGEARAVDDRAPQEGAHTDTHVTGHEHGAGGSAAAALRHAVHRHDGQDGVGEAHGRAIADTAQEVGGLAGHHAQSLMDLGEQVIEILANPVIANGQVTGAVILMVDVTEREQRESLRREFSANVSHELKTPLTSISGFAELMKEGLVDPETMKEFAGDIYKECQQLIALVEDIMKLSRLDEGSEDLEQEDVDLYGLARKVLSDLRPIADQRGIALHIEGKGQKIHGDWRILHEMVYNLCENAIKYNKDQGSVTVKLSGDEKQAVLSVQDTGIGIPKAHQERVFERFYRVDKRHSRKIGGTGLGLSIVKHGAQFHHARVSLDSEPGVGTTITISFPKEASNL